MIAKRTPAEVAANARSKIKNPRAAAAKAAKSIKPGHLKKKAAERKKLMGPIDRTKSYPQDKFCELTGMRRLSWRRALDSGLKVTRVGTTLWVTGESYYEWLRLREGSEAASAPESVIASGTTDPISP